MLVDVSAYNPDYTEPIWIPVERVYSGTAAEYPLEGQVPNRGIGRWKQEEVLGFRVRQDWLNDRIISGIYDGHQNAVEREEARGDSCGLRRDSRPLWRS